MVSWAKATAQVQISVKRISPFFMDVVVSWPKNGQQGIPVVGGMIHWPEPVSRWEGIRGVGVGGREVVISRLQKCQGGFRSPDPRGRYLETGNREPETGD